MVTRLAAVAVGALVATFGVSATASATPSDEGAYSTSFWDGAGALHNDFGDHYDEIGNSLCDGCANSWNTGSVRTWQAILWVEGFLSSPSDIDGKFGSGTHTATQKYQIVHDLGVDGKVGPETWEYADDQLSWVSSQTRVRYDGAKGDVMFERGNSAHGNPGGGGAYRLISACIVGNVGQCTSFGSPRIYH